MINENSCGYSTEWQEYRNCYDKNEYDIRLKDGRVRTNCYPNGGRFFSIDPIFKNGGGGYYASSVITNIRITPKESQKWCINRDSLYETLLGV